MWTRIMRILPCFTAVIGFICYGLSSNHIIGNWNIWKVTLYTLFSFIMCLSVFFAKKCEDFITTSIKFHLIFSVFGATTVYSYFHDEVQINPNVFSLISSAAFAIMSLSLSKQTKFGFEVDLLTFFCGHLILQLMKLNLFFTIPGFGFGIFIFYLHLGFGGPNEIRDRAPEIRDGDVVIQVDSNSEVTTNNTMVPPAIIQMVSPNVQEETLPNTNSSSITAPIGSPSQQRNIDNRVQSSLEICLKELGEMDERLNNMIFQKVLDGQVFDDNSDQLENIWGRSRVIEETKDIKKNICKALKKMFEAGYVTEYCNAYDTLRNRFINTCLCRFQLEEFSLSDVKKEDIGTFINAFKAALNILRNERRLFDNFFFGFSLVKCNIFSSLDWIRVEFDWLAKLLALQSRVSRPSFYGCAIHPLTRKVMKRLMYISRNFENAATCFNIPGMIQLLETNVDVKSKSYTEQNRALGYLFKLNNTRFIQVIASYHSLLAILGADWDRMQSVKVLQNIKDYLRCSWEKVTRLLVRKGNENDSTVTLKVFVDTMRLFDHHFLDACRAQSTCFVIDDTLRKAMRLYLKKMLLLLYENFIGRFQDVLGKDVVDHHIKYSIKDIEVRLKNLFLESQSMNQFPEEGKHRSQLKRRVPKLEHKYDSI